MAKETQAEQSERMSVLLDNLENAAIAFRSLEECLHAVGLSIFTYPGAKKTIDTYKDARRAVYDELVKAPLQEKE